MKRIDIRGVIVPSDYDNSWFESYIQRGVITPESRFRKALAEAKGEELEIYINSPGGSVFAGNEIINAIRDAAKSGQKMSLIVGAWAASMAANTLILTGLPVKAHKNSKIMFHGALSYTEGGAQAHEDTAGLLEKINADIKAELVKRGTAAEKVDEWFAEGREGWLTSSEAKAAGIVADIIDADDASKAAVLKMEDVSDLAKHKLQIAACAGLIEIEAATGGEAVTSVPVTPPPPAPAGAAVSPEPEAVITPAGPPPEPVNEVAKLHDLLTAQAARVTELEALLKTATEAAEASKASAKAMQAAKDKEVAAIRAEFQAVKDADQKLLESRQAEIVALTQHKQEIEARLSRLTVAAIVPSDAAPQGFPEAVKACGGDVAEATRRFPELQKAFIRAEARRLKKG